MGGILRLAFRNMLRNRRRSLITMVAVALGLAFMIWGRNLNSGSYDEMIKVGVSQMAGHVVLQTPGWQESKDQELHLVETATLVDALQEAFPDATVIRRSFLSGLVSSTSNSVGIGLNTVEPLGESRVADWESKVDSGAWLEADDTRGIMLGTGVADSLQVEVGDKVVFMTQGDEDVSSRLFRVRGTLRTGSRELDGFFALAHLDAGAELLGTPGAAHQVSLHLPDPHESEAATRQARALFPGQDLDILNWKEAIPEVYQLIKMDEKYNLMFMFIIGLIVAVGMANTVLMAVMERMREFGVLLAVGMSPRRLAGLVVAEGFLIGLVSVTLGVVLGTLLTWPLVVYGLDMTAFMGESYEVSGIAISAVIFPQYDWVATFLFAFGGVLMTVLATLYPAIKAARLQPVEAMRHV